MSSMYPPYNAVPQCQRCHVPLTVNEPRCANCGYYNTVLPERGPSQQNQQPPAWNQTPSQPLQREPQANQPQQQSDGGLLKRYSVPTEQRNKYVPPSTPVAPPQAMPTQLPFANNMPPQARQQPEMMPYPIAQSLQTRENNTGYARQSGQLLHNGNYSQSAPQSASPSPFATGPTAPPTNFGMSSNQMPPTYTQAPRFSYEEPRKRKTAIGKIIGVLILLLVIIGGSFLAYTFLFTHKSSQQAARATPLHTPVVTTSAPQGTPLFQDNFTNNTNGWSIQSYPGEFSVALGNGVLKLENDNNKLLWELVPGGKSYGDFQLSVDAVLSKGSQDNGYGVYIRGALSQNMSITSFYRFELYGDGSFAVFKGTTDANGTLTTPRLVDYTNNTSIQKQGSLNHITINAKGSSLQFIVNGQTVSTVTDTTYTGGSAALFVSNLQKAPSGAEATFSHLAIYSAQK